MNTTEARIRKLIDAVRGKPEFASTDEQLLERFLLADSAERRKKDGSIQGDKETLDYISITDVEERTTYRAEKLAWDLVLTNNYLANLAILRAYVGSYIENNHRQAEDSHIVAMYNIARTADVQISMNTREYLREARQRIG